MTDWTSGYVADIDYTFGYYTELNPLRVKLAFLNAGRVAPDYGTACELGFGQGISANIHAAASLTSWHGTDFNPAQAEPLHNNWRLFRAPPPRFMMMLLPILLCAVIFPILTTSVFMGYGAGSPRRIARLLSILSAVS